MKFFSDRLFGHPVLNDTKDENNDYPSKVFDCGFEVKFSENDFTKYSIEYDFNLDSNILNYHIENGDIRFVLRISCNSTLYSSSEYCQQTGSIEIECNRLRQSVEFQGLLIAARSFKLVSNSELHKDFRDISFELEKGAVLGYPQPKELYLDKNVFKNVTSVFEYHIVPTQPYGTFDVDLDGQKILIVLSEKQKSLIQMWLRRTETSDIAVNAVFVPAVMQAVKLLRESDDNLDTRWAEIIRAKCEMKDIPLNSDSDSKTDLMIAQRLLDMPLNKLNTKFPLRG